MTDHELALLRDLARQHALIAQDEENLRRIARWKATVSGRQPDRMPVLCRLDSTAHEILREEDLRCTDPQLRGLERRLRWELFTATLGDDHCLSTSQPCGPVVRQTTPADYGLDNERQQPSQQGGAWKSIPSISQVADLDRLVMPAWTYDADATARKRSRLEEIFDGIAPVESAGGPSCNTMYDMIAERFIGYGQLLEAVLDEPELVHRLMAFLRDSSLAEIDWYEAQGLVCENNHHHKYNSDSLKTDPSAPTSCRERWIWSNSQIFDVVGPDQFETFLLDYQKPVFHRFGAVSYGCCENLTHKLERLLTIPNLRIFVNSAWTDLARTAPICAEHGLVIEWRQLATDMLGSPDFQRWDDHLRHGLQLTSAGNRWIVLQEVQTTEGDVDKFRRWCATAVHACEELTGSGSLQRV
ncbi:MAG: hypothetical protein ACOCXA_06855 [Planctomycetota bacterium]